MRQDEMIIVGNRYLKEEKDILVDHPLLENNQLGRQGVVVVTLGFSDIKEEEDMVATTNTKDVYGLHKADDRVRILRKVCKQSSSKDSNYAINATLYKEGKRYLLSDGSGLDTRGVYSLLQGITKPPLLAEDQRLSFKTMELDR